MTKLFFVLLFSFFACFPLQAQTLSENLFYPKGSVPKRFGFYVNDTLRSSIQFGDSRFESLGTERVGYHENGIILDTALIEPIAYPNTFIDKLQVDTISIKLFSLPNLPFEQLKELNQFLADFYFVPVFIESANLDEEVPLREFTIRIPFPDSLFPPNSLVTYPDSADIKLQAVYKKKELLSDQAPSKRVSSSINLSLSLSAEIKPFIGSAVELSFPILDSYPIEFYYYTDNYGFGGFKTLDYELKVGTGSLGDLQTPLIEIPGVELRLNEHQVRTSTDKEIELEIPYLIELSAYPNPFNPSTSIRLNLFEASTVDLNLYSVTGEFVKSIFSEASLQVGQFEYRFDGYELSSGVYFVQARVFSNSGKVSGAVLKITLLK
ncbi:MAG: T9SS type A sorting domain-containing protein [Bacteroidetes bacterium]|nr:T9SS type A sorting domain-containing protein [Bacteroidota bacterium]